MAVRTTKRRGKRCLVIDFTYTKPDGSKGRYRRDAEVQTRAAAHAEHQRRLAAVAATGSPFEIIDKAVRQQVAPVKDTSPTFKEVCEGYLQTYAVSHLKPSTRRVYEQTIRAVFVPWFGERSIKAIDAAAIREFLADMVRRGWKQNTRRRVLTGLRSILCRYAVEEGFFEEAPKLPKPPSNVVTILNVLSREEVDRLLAASKFAENRLTFMLAAYAGLRLSEVRGLRVQDVDLVGRRLIIRQSITGRGVAHTPKSGKGRIVPLAAPLFDALAALPLHKWGRDELVARGARGAPWGVSVILPAFKRAAKRAGLDPTWRFHDLRHFFVTELLRRGVPIHVVKVLAGHAEISTTMRYAHVLQVDLDKAINVLAPEQSEARRVDGTQRRPRGGRAGAVSSTPHRVAFRRVKARLRVKRRRVRARHRSQSW